jgi:uncharacterized YigZ family protein
MIDSYRTLAGPSKGRITRKKSRFLAFLIPVASADEVEAKITEARRAHHDAAHHCTAYRLIASPKPIVASDDAGEPSGSAGPSILHRLEEADLFNVLAVVVRYFGGTKLGVGGLIRAYSDATEAALNDARVVIHHVTVEVLIRFPADVNSGVMATIHRCGAEVRYVRYGESAEIRVRLAPSGVSAFRAAIREATGDRATTEVLG